MAEPLPTPAPAPGQTWVDQSLGGSNPEDQIAVVAPDGRGGTVARKNLSEALQNGFQLEHPAATESRAEESYYGSRPIEAGAEAALSTATFGLSRFINPEHQRKVQGHNETAATVGGVAGAFLPVGAAGIIGKAGMAAEGLLGLSEGAGVAAKVGGGIVRGGVEGMGYGLGAGVEQVALSEKPMSWENAAATIGSNVLGGGAIGGVIGGGAKLLSEGAVAAKAYADKQVEAITKGTQGAEAEATNRAAYPEFAELDQKGIGKVIVEEEGVVKAKKAADIAETKSAYKAEETKLAEQKTAQARDLYQDASAYKEEARQVFIPAGDDAELAAQFGGSMDKIRGGLDNETGFIAKKGAGKFMEGLQEQETALKKAVARSEGVLEQAEQKQQALFDSLPKEAPPVEQPLKFTDVASETEAGKAKRSKIGFGGEVPEEPQVYLTPEQAESYRDWRGTERVKGMKPLAIPESELFAFRNAVEAGEALPMDVLRAQRAPELLAKNQALQARFAEVQGKPTSEYLTHLETKLEQIKHDATPTPRLQAAKAHQADLQTPRGLGHTIAQGMGGAVGGKLGFMAGGPLGAVAGAFVGRDLGIQAFEKLTNKLAKSGAQRGKVIKTAIAKMFSKGAGATAKVLPNMTKIIPAIQYASKKHADSQLGPDDMRPSKDATVTAFRQRARELNSVTEPVADGSYQPRMLALSDLHDRVAALWQISPEGANGVEKLQAAKWAFLASKLPRNPAPPSLQIGPDSWEPSKQQMSLFARYMEVAERPEAAVERLADGTISPGDVETLKAVWPAHYDEIRQECMNHAATMQRTLPYVQRLNLSILLDVDVDPALSPAAMQVFQAPPPQPSEPASPAQQKSLPMGMIEPTQAQRMSSK